LNASPTNNCRFICIRRNIWPTTASQCLILANSDGDILLTVEGKPAAVVNRLIGSSEPHLRHNIAMQSGEMLARMHLAGKDYNRHQPNLRGLALAERNGASGSAIS
jgi:Ser/Thr protein kinase RdoA (MazF antagonist)